MRNRLSCIYAIISPSGRAYIGSTAFFLKRRNAHLWDLRNGKHHCHALSRAFKKYGADALEFIVLEECETDTLIEREQWWIDNHKPRFKGLYNSSGLAGRVERTPEMRAHMSALMKGRIISPETRDKIRAAAIGRVPSQQARENMSKARLGRKLSDEHCRKIGDAHRGIKYSDDAKTRIRKSVRGQARNNTSGAVGVTFCQKSNKWKSTIYLNGGKGVHLGTFAIKEDAIAARKAAELKYWVD